MAWDNINMKTVISKLSDAERLNADGSYNTGYKLTDEVVAAMIYAENDLLPADKKKNIYVQPCTDDANELQLYAENINQALREGKTVLLPITNGKHFVLTAIMPQMQNGQLVAADVVYMNSTKDEANPHLTEVGKETAKAVQGIVSQGEIKCKYAECSREIQYDECCGLSVVQNAMNVIQSKDTTELIQRSDVLENEIKKQSKKDFYQEIGSREHSLLIQAPKVQAAITSPEKQQKLDRQLAFALQKEEIDKLMRHDLAKAVKAKDISAASNLLIQVGIAMGEYGYADIDKQAQAMEKFRNELAKADVATYVGETIKKFGIKASDMPDDFNQMRVGTSNKWQEKIRQEQPSASKGIG